MAELTFIKETKEFRYEDGSYLSTGSKNVNLGVFTSLEGGNIYKGDAHIASYNYAVANGAVSNLWVNFNDTSEISNALAQINACFAALNTENE